MKTYYLKIRDKFISDIKNRIKKHEYRLASPERMQAKIGDTFVLVSNQNKENFVRVTIKKLKIYNSWQEALVENWEQDFKNSFSSLEETLKECYKFYTKAEVDRYGIVVFDIEPLYIDYSKASILLDTNIFIKRESSNNVSFEINNLFKWFDKNNIQKYLHKATVEELKTYKDEKVKNAMVTKVSSYNILPSFNSEKDDYFEHVISRYAQDINSQIDNSLLLEVYNDNVGVLVTDDGALLKKAKDLYIRDRVITSTELLGYFEKTYPKNIEYKMLAVKLKTFGEVDLGSEFFDTLREDYGGKDFDDWFKRKAQKNEQAYVFEDNDGLKGFLYLKLEDEQENYSDITPILSPKKRLKVGTFKIDRTGFRLGERFLKIIFDNAKKYCVDEIYVTLYEDKREGVKQVKNIMEQWGFVKHGYKSNGEAVLTKDMKNYAANKSPKLNFPLINQYANFYFLPIYPEYHTDLFPDNILKNEDMHLYDENKAHRYALEKIYLSGAYCIPAKAGDLALIYRTGERQPKKYSSVVTGVTIIQEIIYTRSLEECIEKCKNRCIFDEDQIKYLYTNKNYFVIIKLLDYVSFKNKVVLNQLYNYRIIANGSGAKMFAPISKEQYEIIYKLGMEE